MRVFASVLLSLALVACGDGTSSDDGGGGGLDASVGADGGGLDAGPDGGPDSTEAGFADAGPGDVDAGDVDAGDVDGGDTCAGAMVDQPCSMEGAFCGGPCTDACSFCNLLSCSGGTWNRVEVFPAPCFECGSTRCETGRQHCVHSYSDVGGVPDTFMCEDNPIACRDDGATCTCLEGELAFDECVAPNPGELEIRYFGG